MTKAPLESAAVATGVAFALFAVWIGRIAVKVRQQAEKRRQFNQVDWKIKDLPCAALWVQAINVEALGSWFVPLLLRVLKKFPVQWALDKSIQAMREADQHDLLPKILCNPKAQQDLQGRLDSYYEDIMQTKAMAPMAKIINFGKIL